MTLVIILLFFLASAFANGAAENVKSNDEENKKRKQQNSRTRENRGKRGKRTRGTTNKKKGKKSKLKSDTKVYDNINDCKDSSEIPNITENCGFTKLTGTKHKEFNCYLCEDSHSTQSALNLHLETRHDVRQDERTSDASYKEVAIHLNGLVILTDSDSKPDGYIVLYRTWPHCTDSDSPF